MVIADFNWLSIFFLGQGDKVKCFYCGGILWDWDPEDEPYTEHAKWFPKCPWLTLSKGDAFVEKVQKVCIQSVQNLATYILMMVVVLLAPDFHHLAAFGLF